MAIGADNDLHVRIFSFVGDNWKQKGGDSDCKLSGEHNGHVSISGDGTRVAIGTGSGSGHVRIFSFVDDDWTQKGGDIVGVSQPEIYYASICSCFV